MTHCHRHSALKPCSRLCKDKFQALILAISPWYPSELRAHGTLRAGCNVQCSGLWSDLGQMHESKDLLPLAARHCYLYHSCCQSQDLWMGERLSACRSVRKTHSPLLTNKMTKQIIRWSKLKYWQKYFISYKEKTCKITAFDILRWMYEEKSCTNFFAFLNEYLRIFLFFFLVTAIILHIINKEI